MSKAIVDSELAIACAAGGYRGAFSHGVLAAFEGAGLQAAVYSAASSTVLPAAYAASGSIRRLGGAEYWKHGWRLYQELGSMSRSYDRGLKEYGGWLEKSLFQPGASRLLIPANKIINEGAAEKAQGDGFLRLGRQLLLAIRQRDRSWADVNLELHWFDSKPESEHRPLTPSNMAEVFYASSRYLHSGWDRPAWIGGEPYIDAVYTAAVPIRVLPETGAQRIVVIHHGTEQPFVDFFQSRSLPAEIEGVEVRALGPDRSLPELGVDVMTATEAGIEAAYQHGVQRGQAWLENRQATGHS